MNVKIKFNYNELNIDFYRKLMVKTGLLHQLLTELILGESQDLTRYD